MTSSAGPCRATRPASAKDSGYPLTKSLRERDASSSNRHPAFSFWLCSVFSESRFAPIQIVPERAD